MVKIKSKGLNIFVQAAKIRKSFPDSKVTVTSNKLIWKGVLKPTFLSESYEIKLDYKVGYHPCIYVINKKLELYEGRKSLPHVYSTEKQWLCLYYRKAREWTSQQLIAETIIPWTSEWLYHYEFWLATGKWHGRGIHGKQEPYEKDKSPAPNNV
ncbi:hypothetical protein [uncultured Draconibacterium sp.]|uniref:hypothetical protein n=1 Tax=uncultured Draconibacterium sp. TaxID=1573823 RepID=UPI003216A4F8